MGIQGGCKPWPPWAKLLSLVLFLFVSTLIFSRAIQNACNAYSTIHSAPALHTGARSSCQERQWRCESLLGKALVSYKRTYTAFRWMSVQHDYPRPAGFWSFPPMDRGLLAIAACPETCDLIHRIAVTEGVYFDLSCYSSTDIKMISPVERYWLFWDLGRMPKPIRKSVPQQMEKP